MNLGLQDRPRPYVMAHRGNLVHCPENALPAFRLAVDEGTDLIETDLHVTSDGHFICMEEYGRLRLIKANSQRCEVVTECDLGSAGPNPEPGRAPERRLLKYPCWAAPILAHGLLYVRGRDRLVCLELIPDPRRE